MLSLSSLHQQSGDMFFTNGALGYTGQTLPFHKCCGDMRNQTDSSSLSPHTHMSKGRAKVPPWGFLHLLHQPQKVRMVLFSVIYVLRKQPQN